MITMLYQNFYFKERTFLYYDANLLSYFLVCEKFDISFTLI